MCMQGTAAPSAPTANAVPAAAARCARRLPALERFAPLQQLTAPTRNPGFFYILFFLLANSPTQVWITVFSWGVKGMPTMPSFWETCSATKAAKN